MKEKQSNAWVNVITLSNFALEMALGELRKKTNVFLSLFDFPIRFFVLKMYFLKSFRFLFFMLYKVVSVIIILNNTFEMDKIFWTILASTGGPYYPRFFY